MCDKDYLNSISIALEVAERQVKSDYNVEGSKVITMSHELAEEISARLKAIAEGM